MSIFAHASSTGGSVAGGSVGGSVTGSVTISIGASAVSEQSRTLPITCASPLKMITEERIYLNFIEYELFRMIV